MYLANGQKKIIIQFFATFAHNISRSKKIKIFNSKSKLKLIYIDDLINLFLQECKLNTKNKIKNIKNFILITPKTS